MTWVRALQADDVAHIARHLREYDRKEVVAELGPDFTDEMVARAMQPGLSYAFGNEQPIAMLGTHPFLSETVWSASMLATEEWPQVAARVSAFVVRQLIPALDSMGLKRVECFSILGHVEAHRWLRWLGAKPKGIRPTRGRNGEKFIRFVWERANVHGAKSTERQQRADRRAAGSGAASAHP